MKILDLYAGTLSVSGYFEKHGWEVYAIDNDKKHRGMDWYEDILKVTAEDIIKRFGVPDVIWASPPCTTYSVAGIFRHRNKIGEDFVPKTEAAELSDRLVQHTIDLIKELNPKAYFIENPRGALRKMSFMQELPMYTVTYCQYGYPYMKPTDIWTNIENPNFLPMCKKGSPCHISAPRGSGKGLTALGSAVHRAVIPEGFVAYIEELSRKVIDK